MCFCFKNSKSNWISESFLKEDDDTKYFAFKVLIKGKFQFELSEKPGSKNISALKFKSLDNKL